MTGASTSTSTSSPAAPPEGARLRLAAERVAKLADPIGHLAGRGFGLDNVFDNAKLPAPFDKVRLAVIGEDDHGQVAVGVPGAYRLQTRQAVDFGKADVQEDEFIGLPPDLPEPRLAVRRDVN